MKRRGRSERLKVIYKKAFEDSFIDSFDGWNGTLEVMNTSASNICKGHRRKHKPYSYDEFCCLAKTVVDEYLDKVDWVAMMEQEETRWRSARSKAAYDRQTNTLVKRRLATMEMEVLFTCFERAIHKVVGPKLYRMYKSEIEQFKEEEVVI